MELIKLDLGIIYLSDYQVLQFNFVPFESWKEKEVRNEEKRYKLDFTSS